MKTNLLLFLVITSLGYSQTAIENYDSVTGSEYVGVTTSVPLDQDNIAAPGGVYNIATLIKSSNSNTIDTHTSPSAGVSVFTANREAGLTIFTTNQSGGNVEYTKIEDNTGIVLTYSNAAEVATFPWNYDASNSSNNMNSDTSAGTFSYSGVSGTFTGTIESTVDWYGTLNINDVLSGNVTSAFNGEVTRLKVVQDVILDAGFIGSGNASLINYFYYDANSNNLVFRTASIEALFNPIIGDPIVLSELIIESLETSTLSGLEFSTSKMDISIYPNPVSDQLYLKLGNDIKVDVLTIIDLSGREVLRAKTAIGNVFIGQLDSGMYMVSILTNKGLWTDKIIKK